MKIPWTKRIGKINLVQLTYIVSGTLIALLGIGIGVAWVLTHQSGSVPYEGSEVTFKDTEIEIEMNQPMDPIKPLHTGGPAPANWKVYPPLPAGLSLNKGTGRISGTPTESVSKTFNVYPDNGSGATVDITVNRNPPQAAWTPSTYSFGVNQPIAVLSPNVTGQATSFSIEPALPSGLAFNLVTGAITGTPTVRSDTANYAVTPVGADGPGPSVLLQIGVVDVPSVIYAPTLTLGLNRQMPPVLPTVTSGDDATNYTITGLPAGLILNPLTGEISGTPTINQTSTNYTITPSNARGNGTPVIVAIAVEEAPAVSYTTPNNWTQNVAITPITPTLVSGSPATSYGIYPDPPPGLSFNTVNGEITGTPTLVSSLTCAVTGYNEGGAGTPFDVVINVS